MLQLYSCYCLHECCAVEDMMKVPPVASLSRFRIVPAVVARLFLVPALSLDVGFHWDLGFMGIIGMACLGVSM